MAWPALLVSNDRGRFAATLGACSWPNGGSGPIVALPAVHPETGLLGQHLLISPTVGIVFLAANPGNRGLAKTLLPPGGLGGVVGTVPFKLPTRPPHRPKMGAWQFLAHVVGRGGGGRFS